MLATVILKSVLSPVVVGVTVTLVEPEDTVYVLFNLALASAVKSTLTLEPFAVVLIYWLTPPVPEPSPLILNLIPLALSNWNLVVSLVSAPKLILLLNLSFTTFNCSSVAARPLVAKSLPAAVGIVVLVNPVMSPVLPFKLIG